MQAFWPGMSQNAVRTLAVRGMSPTTLPPPSGCWCLPSITGTSSPSLFLRQSRTTKAIDSCGKDPAVFGGTGSGLLDPAAEQDAKPGRGRITNAGPAPRMRRRGLTDLDDGGGKRAEEAAAVAEPRFQRQQPQQQEASALLEELGWLHIYGCCSLGDSPPPPGAWPCALLCLLLRSRFL